MLLPNCSDAGGGVLGLWANTIRESPLRKQAVFWGPKGLIEAGELTPPTPFFNLILMQGPQVDTGLNKSMTTSG